MKSLQDKYNLIKEGKGNKELFIKEARTMFPNIVTGALTFDQSIHNLTERGIISEGITGVLVQRENEPNWFKIFTENTEKVKSDLKKTDKSVEEKEIAGYDYEDKSNNNNISTAEILKGYYAEMKDPKNADKTEEELKKIVFKNLEKDPMYYIKDGAFGIKGIGYTEDAPGLGKTKEVTGKYKSSGMEPVKLNEVFYGSSDGDYDADQEAEQMAYYNYDKGLEAYSEGDFLRAEKYYTTALRYGSYINLTEKDLPPYNKSENTDVLSEAKKRAIEKHIKEIEKLGEVAAWDHKITKIQEKIEELMNEMTMTEGDEVSKYVDKKAVKELKRDISVLEKRKALYEKKRTQAAKKVTDKSAMQTAAGKDVTVMEEKEEEKPHTPPADPDRDLIFRSMKRDTAPKPKKESWSGMVRELINKKNLKIK